MTRPLWEKSLQDVDFQQTGQNGVFLHDPSMLDLPHVLCAVAFVTLPPDETTGKCQTESNYLVLTFVAGQK